MSDILPFVEDTLPMNVSNQEYDSYRPGGGATNGSSHLPNKPSKLEDKEKNKKENKDENSNPNEVTSLSLDQVNDNADELIELRGEGRYFGVTDPSSGTTINNLQSLGPLCGNCHRRGHIRLKCKTVVCHKCGVVGDHYETQCPTTMICSRCGLKGHIAVNCTNKVKKKQYCKACDSFSHGDDTCPTIWRSYITLPTSIEEQNSTVLPIIYCYNCGDNTHYGDECSQMRSSRVPNSCGSAFTGDNLPRHLRDLYFRRIKESKRNHHSDFKSYNGPPPIRLYQNNNKIQPEPRNYGKRSRDYNYNNNNRYDYNNGFGNGYNKQQPNPSRSGYLDHSNNRNNSQKNYNNPTKYAFPSGPNQKSLHQPNRSGYITNNLTASKPNKPTRSGMIEKSSKSKKQKKNMNMLY